MMNKVLVFLSCLLTEDLKKDDSSPGVLLSLVFLFLAAFHDGNKDVQQCNSRQRVDAAGNRAVIGVGVGWVGGR